MSKRHSRKPVAPTRTAGAPVQDRAPGPTRERLPVAFIARLALALAVAVFALLSARHVVRMVRADVGSQWGFQTARDPMNIGIGIERLQAVNVIAPSDPVTQFRLGNLLVMRESARASARGAQAVDFQQVSRALQLLNQSALGYPRPQLSYLRSGQTAFLIAEILQGAGRQEEAADYASIATRNLLEYRRIQGAPELEPQVFYTGAVSAAHRAKEFQSLLLFMDDAAWYYPDRTVLDERRQLQVLDARYVLGEHFLLILETRALLARDPASTDALQLLRRVAQVPAQRPRVISSLRSLGAEGTTSPQMTDFLAELAPGG